MPGHDVEKESLKDSVEHIEEEARMVLPGIQALFGFQLIAVFNQRFASALTGQEQVLHWLALFMTALAILFALAPAAYHRIAEPGFVSRRFINLAGKWLCLGMVPLIVGLCLDFYLVGAIATQNRAVAGAAAVFLLLAFTCFWFVYPARSRRKHPLKG